MGAGWLCLLTLRFLALVRLVLCVRNHSTSHLLIGGFVLCRKKLFSSVHYFVHLNLAISLLIGYVVFMFGIELGTGSKVYNPLSITH